VIGDVEGEADLAAFDLDQRDGDVAVEDPAC
jgi:hypothetical protein